MQVVYWPVDNNGEAEEVEINSMDQLWEFVREKKDPVIASGHLPVLELSANEPYEGQPRYLVLAWVEVEE